MSCWVSLLIPGCCLAISLLINFPDKFAIAFKTWASGDLGEKSVDFLPSIIPAALNIWSVVMFLFFVYGERPAPLVSLSLLV